MGQIPFQHCDEVILEWKRLCDANDSEACSQESESC